MMKTLEAHLCNNQPNNTLCIKICVTLFLKTFIHTSVKSVVCWYELISILRVKIVTVIWHDESVLERTRFVGLCYENMRTVCDGFINVPDITSRSLEMWLGPLGNYRVRVI